MAIRRVIECDFCNEEVNGVYYTIRAKEFDNRLLILPLDLPIETRRRYIICDDCRHHVKELLWRLSDIKRKKNAKK